MDAKNSKKRSSSKTWKCPVGCVLTSTPCPHLEERLPQMDDGSLGSRPLNDLDLEAFSLSDTNLDLRKKIDLYEKRRSEERKFRKVLRAFHLAPEAIIILTDKFINNLTLKEIAKKRGFTSKATAGYYYRKICKELKLRGLKVK